MQISRDKLRQKLPKSIFAVYRAGRAALNSWKYRGSKYYCVVCGSHLRQWIYAGPISHQNFVCPVCYSYGRHRMMAQVIDCETVSNDLLPGRTLLHFAPEVGLQRWLKRRMPLIKYLSADLMSPDVDLHLDLQEISLPSNSIHMIILSHVLEHVGDDIQALNELYRILVPGGKLFLQVPLSGNPETIDDKLETSDARLARYGKTDHVRLYGMDLVNRIASAGFEVTTLKANGEPYLEQFTRMALDLPEESSMLYDNESTTFVCRKLG